MSKTIYVLTQDVQNPSLDRRRTTDLFAKPILKAETLWVKNEYQHEVAGIPVTNVTWSMVGTYGSFGEDDPVAKAITPHLKLFELYGVPTRQRFRALREFHGFAEDLVLRHLWYTGTITTEQLVHAAQEIAAMTEEEVEAL